MKKVKVKNPVAKNMERFNRPATHKDKTKYRRKAKHNKNKGWEHPLFFVT